MRISVQGLILLLAAALPLGVQAGALYGTIRSEHGPLGDVQIDLACPRFFEHGALKTSALSDSDGSFALRLPFNGKCEMRVQRGTVIGRPFEVYLFESAVRFDFVVGQELEKVQ